MNVKIEPVGERLLARIECVREDVDCVRKIINKKLFRKQMECMAQQDFDAFVELLAQQEFSMSELDSQALLVFAKNLYKSIGRVDFVIANDRFNAVNTEEEPHKIFSFQGKTIEITGDYTLGSSSIEFTNTGSNPKRLRVDYSDQIFDEPTWGVMIYGKGSIIGSAANGFGGSSGSMMLAIDSIDGTKLKITDADPDLPESVQSSANIWNSTVSGMATYVITGENSAKAFRNGEEVVASDGLMNYSDMIIEDSYLDLWNSGESTNYSMQFGFFLFPSDSETLIDYQSALYSLYKSTIGA
jgi:hypothetical protein